MTCGDGQKHGYCKHSLVHTYRMEECTIPREYARGVHRRRGQVGRPRKRAPALERQADALGLASHLPPPQQVRRLDGQETPGTLPVAPPRRSTRGRNTTSIVDM